MAEVQAKDSGGGGKNKQKKQTLRVDFTPMVDMNMLLITFFMMATTLLKPQTMDLNMPSKDKPQDGQENKVQDTDAVTLLLGADNQLFFYEGMLKTENYEDLEFLKSSEYGADGIRQLLLNRNREAYSQIQDLKEQLKNLDITQEEFNEKSVSIQKELMKAHKVPTIMIKATEQSTYKNLVDALDEMLITNIGAYAIVDITDGDRYLLFKKTDNAEYLTEAQRAEAAGV
ncbi:biopolymer transporter ExbD [Bacteroidales bacterium OttesenSCG-928-M11]|nr:biopolymer transporter ExbD [Bacteroidales bacterium OttesenSCG-928-M11]